ncbi:hypothetical protein CYMTET_7440 [Cymbomonas tetramitiformis]|uniref:Uncharacterized protein n=1 Tax=Cymbomonas tetramitiformis TaxID=36881 RepID=A0AAE0GWY2_9CHLO|nr:hypothetical protein CYMTET_7440 [Cymbomonas tetramitiformis]
MFSFPGDNFRITSTLFFANNASGGGGGLLADSGSVATLDQCRFERNVAATQGGALFSAGNLTLTASDCVDNSAGDGGAVSVLLTLPHQAVEVRGTSFVNNSAGRGAVVYVEEAFSIESTVPGTGPLVELSELWFEGNTARAGGSIMYWDPLEMTATTNLPTCINCTDDVAAAGNIAAYAS